MVLVTATPQNNTILDIAKIADKRMYQAKSAYYAKKGVDRRGQAAANTALCNLYTKIFILMYKAMMQ